MTQLHKTIQQAKSYQLEICATKMLEVYNNATDNLTGLISSSVHHLCNEELVKRGQPAILTETT